MTIIRGTANSDQLQSLHDTGDLLVGLAGNDTLIGGVGQDTLQGGDGDDSLTGGAGDDLLQGGLGNNTYFYAYGDGHDTIASQVDTRTGKLNKLVLDTSLEGVSEANFQRIGNDLVFTVDEANGLTVKGFFTSANPIQVIALPNGLSWNASQIQQFANGLRLNAPGFEGDLLTGGDYNDTISGGFGEDTLIGGKGNDYIDGGTDNDTIDGGDGNDTVLGDYGNDSLTGGAGDDSLNGSYGDDTLSGGTGNDFLDGDYGNDLLDGGAGNDTLNGGFDNDTVLGGAGNDSLNGDFGDDVLDGGLGDDTLDGGFGNDVIQGGAGNDVLTNTIGADTLDGGAGNDLIRNDSFDATEIRFGKGDGQDTLLGVGAGFLRLKAGVTRADVTAHRQDEDLLVFVSATDVVTVKNYFAGPVPGANAAIQGLVLADGTTADAAAIQALIASNQRHLVGTNANDTIQGGITDDLIEGGKGNDVLYGGAGFDTLVGGAGTDTLVGGTGNDTYVIDSASDVITEQANEGRDTVVLSGFSYALNTGKLVNVENLDATVTQAATFTGNALDNRIRVSGTGNARLSGLAGNDTLQGGAGNDTLDGGTGNNTYIFGKGSGQDTIVKSTDTTAGKYNAVRFSEDVQYYDLVFTQQGANLKVAIQGTTDTLTIEGFFQGNDPANAANPVQAFYLNGSDTPTFSAQTVQDIVLSGDDHITGTAQADLLRGGAGKDLLEGLAGNDTLDGGTGNDTLNGGTGSNTYLYARGDGLDVIEAGTATASSGTSTLRFKAGIQPADIKLRHIGNDLVVSLSQNERITVRNFFTANGSINAASPVQQIAFTDGGTTLTSSAIAQLALPANAPIVGTSGNDTLNGDYDSDSISGGAGNDQLNGNGGTDTLDGGLGDDTLTGSGRLIGGEGNDSYFIDAASGSTIVEKANGGTDTLYVTLHDTGPGTASFSLNTPELAEVENVVAYGYDGPVNTPSVGLTGNAKNNYLSASGPLGNATLYGLDGNDTLSGYFMGSDMLVGGNGDDTYILGRSGDVLVEEADGGIDTIDARSGESYIGLDSSSGHNIENILLGYTYFDVNGNELDNTISIGQLGGKTVDGKAGADTYKIGSGSGTVVFDNAGDRVVRAPSSDTEDGSNGGITVRSSVNVDLSQSQGVYIAELTGNANLAIQGTSRGDKLTGNAADNTLRGGGGNDTLEGGAGNDVLDGGQGANTFRFGAGDGQDTIQGRDGTGTNTLLFKSGATSFSWTRSGLDLVLSTSDTDKVTIEGFFHPDGQVDPNTPVQFFEYEDTGIIQTAQQLINGETGSPRTISGTDGADTFQGTDSSELIFGLGGDDVFLSSKGNDTLDGGSGSDSYSDYSGNNTILFGRGDGQDVINGPGGYGFYAGRNTLVLKAGIKPEDLVYSVDRADLTLSIAGTQDSILLRGFFDVSYGPYPAGGSPIDAVHFTDTGETWTPDQLAFQSAQPGTLQTGTDGNDTLVASDGVRDTLAGGAGDDTYSITHVTTVKEEAGQGIDTISVGGSFSLDSPEFANIENLSGATGGNGGATYTLTGNALDNKITANAGLGGAKLDLYGLDGNDTLVGTRLGGSMMVGGKGNDTYVVSYRDEASTIVELADEGVDTIVMSYDYNSRFTLDSVFGQNVENLKSDGYAAGNVNGNKLDNVIELAWSGAAILDGKEGADTYRVHGGGATFVFDNVGDKAFVDGYTRGVIQATVNVDLAQQVGVNEATLKGNADLTVVGNDGANGLIGNDGNNVITGRLGDDTLAGGLGNDTYHFAAGDGQDVINDVGGENDVLSLQGYAASQVAFAQSGQDLTLTLAGSGDKITVSNWFAAGDNRLESIKVDDGSITNQQVDALIQAMAGGTPAASASAGAAAPSPQPAQLNYWTLAATSA